MVGVRKERKKEEGGKRLRGNGQDEEGNKMGYRKRGLGRRGGKRERGRGTEKERSGGEID